jgi:hypothetical protein
MSQKKSNFKCSQQELYAVCKLGWEGCNLHIEKFQNFSPKYTPEFLAARRQEIDNVAEIPDKAVRSSMLELLRVELREQTRLSLDRWLRLKRYITVAYPQSAQAAKLKAAGKAHYKSASTYSWEACQGLLKDASVFIAAETENLLRNDKMPLSFPNDFNMGRDAFEVIYLRYLDASKQAAQKTDEKLTANNHLHDMLMEMMLDGREIFRHDEVMEKQFRFDYLLLNVSGPGSAGVKGTVTIGTLTTGTRKGATIEGALLTLLDTNHTCITDDEGWYQFTQLPAGTYSLEVKASGFVPLRIDNIEIKTGNMSNLHVQLQPEG